jgi:enoyl-CoA hydratase
VLAWICDLIVAADGAFFADPVVRMGIPGVEYFAHPFVMGPRFAKEFLFLGERITPAGPIPVGGDLTAQPDHLEHSVDNCWSTGQRYGPNKKTSFCI